MENIYTIDITEKSEIALQRSTIYNFLKCVYYKEPDKEFIAVLKYPKIAITLKKLGLVFNNESLNLDTENGFNDLVVEYTRLFIGPGKHYPPYESVWRSEEGAYMGDSTIQINSLIASLGLTFEDEYAAFPDHIAVEFELLRLLTGKESQSWIMNNDDAMVCIKAEKNILTKHLTQWIPNFCDAIIENAHEEYYREMAKLTKAFIAMDATHITEKSVILK